LGNTKPDELDEARDSTARREQADEVLAESHAGALRGKTEIARERQLQAGPGRHTVDCGKHRLLQSLRPVIKIGENAPMRAEGGRGPLLLEERDVAAGREGLAASGENPYPDLGRLEQGREGGKLAAHDLVNRVARARSVQRHSGDAVGIDFVEEGLEGL